MKLNNNHLNINHKETIRNYNLCKPKKEKTNKYESVPLVINFISIQLDFMTQTFMEIWSKRKIFYYKLNLKGNQLTIISMKTLSISFLNNKLKDKDRLINSHQKKKIKNLINQFKLLQIKSKINKGNKPNNNQ